MMRGSALYGSEIFDVAPITLIKQFGKVAKLLLGGYRSDSPSAAVEFLGWDPICWARITRVKFAVRMLAVDNWTHPGPILSRSSELTPEIQVILLSDLTVQLTLLCRFKT